MILTPNSASIRAILPTNVYIIQSTPVLSFLKHTKAFYENLWPCTKEYIFPLYSYVCLIECTYQGLIYTATMSNLAYKVYVDFSHFPDV
jgi:hypothetical protein